MDLIDKKVLVSLEDEALDAPMVIDEVGVEEVEPLGPTFPLGWKAAQEEHLASRREEGEERVVFYIGGRALYVCKV